MTMLVPDAGRLAATYFEALGAKDFYALGSILAEDVTFDGPMGHAEGRDDYVRQLEKLAEIIDDVVVERVYLDGDDVLTWFAFHTNVAGVLGPIASWIHSDGHGHIDRVQVSFDPRPLTDPQPQSGQ